MFNNFLEIQNTTFVASKLNKVLDFNLTIKNEGDIPKYPLSTKQPKADGIRYALLVYENRHRGSNFEIAKWIAKREEKKRGSGLTSSSLFFGREDVQKDMDVVDKMITQSMVGRYMRLSNKYLLNVCLGIFP